MSEHEFATVDQYVRAFEVTRADMPVDLVQAHLDAPDYTTTWQQLAEAVGKRSYRGVNARYGNYASKIAKHLGLITKPAEGFWLYTLVRFADKPGVHGHTAYVLRTPVIEALRSLGFRSRNET
ncbi:hypothetical protein BH20VER1_BH20VER1_22810 [soil metagenome]